MIKNDMQTPANTHLISSRSQINSCNVLKKKVMLLQYSQIIGDNRKSFTNWPFASISKLCVRPPLGILKVAKMNAYMHIYDNVIRNLQRNSNSAQMLQNS